MSADGRVAEALLDLLLWSPLAICVLGRKIGLEPTTGSAIKARLRRGNEP